jgi:hypothetical protein
MLRVQVLARLAQPFASSVIEAGGGYFHGCLFAFNSLLRTRVRTVFARARKSMRVQARTVISSLCVNEIMIQ